LVAPEDELKNEKIGRGEQYQKTPESAEAQAAGFSRR